MVVPNALWLATIQQSGISGQIVQERGLVWGQWEQFAVIANQDGRLEVFVISMSDSVWHASQTAPNGSFSGWSDMKRQWKQLRANRQPDGTLQVIALGFDYETYRITQTSPNSGWGNWQKLYMGQNPGSGVVSKILWGWRNPHCRCNRPRHGLSANVEL